MRGCACRGTAGFAHVSCLAEQAKILVAEAEENNLGSKVLKFAGLIVGTRVVCASQNYHGVVRGGARVGVRKTYLVRAGPGSEVRDATAWERIIPYKTLRGRVDVEEALLDHGCGALAHQNKVTLPRAEQYCAHVSIAWAATESALNMYRDVLFRIFEALGRQHIYHLWQPVTWQICFII